jgi:Putative MetA-pathway of phenol degradation
MSAQRTLPSRPVLPRLHAAALGLVWLAAACRATATPAAGPAEDDVPPISTDRPGLLFAPTLVPAGRLQVETGLPTLALRRDSGDETRAWSFPVALRYGASETIELRASLPTWTDTRVESGSTAERDEGFGDSEVGAKLALAPLAGGPLSLLGSLRLPTGADDFTTDEVGGAAYLLHGRDLGDSGWLQALLGLTHTPIDGAEDQTAGALAALVSHPLAERWSAYAEATALPGIRHAAGQAYLGGGLVLAASRRVQLDLSADFGLDDDSDDVLAAVGLSWFF